MRKGRPKRGRFSEKKRAPVLKKVAKSTTTTKKNKMLVTTKKSDSLTPVDSVTLSFFFPREIPRALLLDT